MGVLVTEELPGNDGSFYEPSIDKMKWDQNFRRALGIGMAVASIVFLTIEVWRNHKMERRILPEYNIPSGPLGPDHEELYDEYPQMMPIFATREGPRMVH